ncbi:hypothetical protein FOZ62_017011, partial [Perkinsus olseni]
SLFAIFSDTRCAGVPNHPDLTSHNLSLGTFRGPTRSAASTLSSVGCLIVMVMDILAWVTHYALVGMWEILARPQVLFLTLAGCYFGVWRVMTAQANAKEAAGRKKDEEHVRLVCGGVSRPDLAKYCEELNGELFPPVGLNSVLQCAISKSYLPMGKAYCH